MIELKIGTLQVIWHGNSDKEHGYASGKIKFFEPGKDQEAIGFSKGKDASIVKLISQSSGNNGYGNWQMIHSEVSPAMKKIVDMETNDFGK